MNQGNYSRDLETLASLRAGAERAGQLSELSADLEAQASRAGRAAVVCLVGPTGAGKSTLLNALAGRPLAIPGADRPTTTVPVIYAPDGVEVPRLDGFREATRHHYQVNSQLPWSGHVLIDAPDVNSIRSDHRDLVAKLALEADVLVVVLHHQGVVEESTTSFVDQWQDRRRLAVVLNRSDEMTDSARKSLMDQTAAMAAQRWGVPADAVFCTSALRAQAGAGQDQGFDALVAWLAGLLESGIVDDLRRDNLRGTERRVASEASLVLDASGQRFDALETAMDDGFAAFSDQAVADSNRRMRARRGDLELTLAREMSKRWRGPGGWLLRFGTWGSVSAVGALAVRRNPLAAGALALGGQAADRLRSSLADYRLDHGSGLAPADSELRSWLLEAFVQARVEADAISSDLGQQVEVSQEQAAEAVCESIAQSWDDVISLDLPEFAESRALRWMRLPLDLPIYALGADVGYRTVLSYLSGSWMPLDFYVNAAALGFLTAAVTYLLTRGFVSFGARVFERRSVAKIRLAILKALELVSTSQKRLLLEPREALLRLSGSMPPGRRQNEA